MADKIDFYKTKKGKKKKPKQKTQTVVGVEHICVVMEEMEMELTGHFESKNVVAEAVVIDVVIAL